VNGADPDAPDQDDTARRRLLTLLGGVLLAFLGAGFGVSTRLGDDTEAESGPDLSVRYTVTPDRSPPTPTPESGGGTGGAGGAAPPGRPDVSTVSSSADDSSDDGSSAGDSRPPADDGDDRSPPTGPAVSPTATPTPSEDLAASAIPPVSLTDVAPGDGGDVDLALSLSGTPARLWVRGDATDFDEGGVLETERTDGDDGPPGELQEYVQVRLWYDADGDGAADERTIYEGSLAGLGAVSSWTPLTDACVAPGSHIVRFRWDLPADAPNRVQTDAASFSLGVAADASECA
jgi:hypothetical protein